MNKAILMSLDLLEDNTEDYLKISIVDVISRLLGGKQVLAYELGHAILYVNLTTSYYTKNNLLAKDKLELQANNFAAELLLEDDLIEKYKRFTLEQIAAIENVPARLVELKYKKDHIRFINLKQGSSR